MTFCKQLLTLSAEFSVYVAKWKIYKIASSAQDMARNRPAKDRYPEKGNAERKRQYHGADTGQGKQVTITHESTAASINPSRQDATLGFVLFKALIQDLMSILRKYINNISR